jgi:hypothetical protein
LVLAVPLSGTVSAVVWHQEGNGSRHHQTVVDASSERANMSWIGNWTAVRVGRRRLMVGASVGALMALAIVSAPLAEPAGATSSTTVLSGVSCIDKVCVVVGSTNNSGGTAVVAKTTNNGSTWTDKIAPAGTSAYNAVVCPSATFCMAVGQDSSNDPDIAVSPATGSHWIAQTPPAADGPLYAVSCQSVSLCWAGGYSAGFTSGAMADTSNGGTTWNPETVPSGASGVTQVTGVSCKGSPTVSCYGSGYGTQYVFSAPYLLKSTSNKTSWTQIPVGVESAGQFNAISCFTAKKCVTVGQVGGAGFILSTTTGTTWTSETVPSGVSTLNGVSCIAATTTCYAVGKLSSGSAALVVSTDSGVTWTSQTAPSGAGDMNAVSCAKSTTCVAVGEALAGGGSVIATSNSGSTWTTETSPA